MKPLTSLVISLDLDARSLQKRHHLTRHFRTTGRIILVMIRFIRKPVVVEQQLMLLTRADRYDICLPVRRDKNDGSWLWASGNIAG